MDRSNVAHREALRQAHREEWLKLVSATVETPPLRMRLAFALGARLEKRWHPWVRRQLLGPRFLWWRVGALIAFTGLSELTYQLAFRHFHPQRTPPGRWLPLIVIGGFVAVSLLVAEELRAKDLPGHALFRPRVGRTPLMRGDPVVTLVSALAWVVFSLAWVSLLASRTHGSAHVDRPSSSTAARIPLAGLVRDPGPPFKRLPAATGKYGELSAEYLSYRAKNPGALSAVLTRDHFRVAFAAGWRSAGDGSSIVSTIVDLRSPFDAERYFLQQRPAWLAQDRATVLRDVPGFISAQGRAAGRYFTLCRRANLVVSIEAWTHGASAKAAYDQTVPAQCSP